MNNDTQRIGIETSSRKWRKQMIFHVKSSIGKRILIIFFEMDLPTIRRRVSSAIIISFSHCFVRSFSRREKSETIELKIYFQNSDISQLKKRKRNLRKVEACNMSKLFQAIIVLAEHIELSFGL